MSKRKGFTLIELLVVIAIIAILIALLVPAVQKVRQSAQNLQCSNNMRQIAIGMLNFEAQYGYFPPGGGGPNNPARQNAYFSWCFHIMPYIEQVNIYNLTSSYGALTDLNTAPNGVAQLAKLDTSLVPIYYCPARRNIQLYRTDAVCDYAGNTGTNNGANTQEGIIVENDNPTYPKVRTRHITDGQSNTLMVAERRINMASIMSGNDCYDNEPAYRPQQDCDVLRRAQPVGGSWLTPGLDIFDATNTNYFCGSGLCQFGSSHSAGMNAALADGSVRRVGYDINALNFKNVCVKNDGQVVDLSLLD